MTTSKPKPMWTSPKKMCERAVHKNVLAKGSIRLLAVPLCPIVAVRAVASSWRIASATNCTKREVVEMGLWRVERLGTHGINALPV